jgi:polar amino acid transport system substrate-binding protein
MQHKISKRFLLVSGLLLALSGPAFADELDDIMKAGVIKVGIFEDFPPFSSAGPDLKSQGYDIDVIDALAKGLGVTPELIGITGQNRIPSLTEHKLNLLVSVGVSDERKKVVAFTQPYAPYSIDVIGNYRDMISNDEKSLCVISLASCPASPVRP